MNPQPARREEPAPPPPREEPRTQTTASPPPAPKPAAEPQPTPLGGHQALLAAAGTRSNQAREAALKEARRYVRLRYFSFLASMLVLAAALIAGTIVMAVSLLGDAAWEQSAAAAAVAGGALLLLILLQYRPASGFAAAAAELSRLQALQAQLETAYALWSAYIEDRERTGQISANEIATAVSSMTAATRDMVALQAAIESSRPAAPAAPPRPTFPTPTVPDPRRY